MNDMVNHPKHYILADGLEFKDVVRATLTSEEYKGCCKGNALKYQFRAGKKDPSKIKEDYQKSVWFLNELIGTMNKEV
jgi:hypothetical protein